MGIFDIRAWPDPVLRQRTREVKVFDENLVALVEAMGAVMRLEKGVGLAANQIGLGKRLFVYDRGDGEVRAVINPVVLELSGVGEGEEGCLSLRGQWLMVGRAEIVRYEAQDVTGTWYRGEIEGFEARVFQHEVDHLDGKVLLNRVDHLRRASAVRELLAG